MKALKSFEPVSSQDFPIKYHYVVNLYKHQELDLSQFSLPFFFFNLAHGVTKWKVHRKFKMILMTSLKPNRLKQRSTTVQNISDFNST